MLISLIVLVSTLTTGVNVHSGVQAFAQVGTMRIGAMQERAALNVVCPEGGGGEFSIFLNLPEANVRKDFDYDDFEGPDAPANAKALSHIAWITTSGTTEITSIATGSYVPVPPESFVFSISQTSHHREGPARLLNAIRDEPGTLVWTQTGFDNAKRQLVATFELDAAAVKRLHDTAAICLPQNLRMKKPT
jgi:hypothetical protein